MALTAGSVSINTSTAVATKSGFAAMVYDAEHAAWIARHATFSPPAAVPTDIKTLVRIRQGFAEEANRAALVITYILANGTAGGDPIL